MTTGKPGSGPGGRNWTRMLDRQWVALALLAWAVLVGWYLWQRWGGIYWLALSDTDDNLRLAQVRAWLGGQDWYDLRQYRLNPPGGIDVHWSRIVDLPIAAIIVLVEPLAGRFWAERWAVGLAPLLPMGVAILALAAAVRRLVAPLAWPLAILFLLGSTATMLMFMPLRIDHHGWQLAMLAWAVAGLADGNARRGGMTVGASSAISLAIGLELLPYAAMAGAILALRWIWDRGAADRLGAYAATLGIGSGVLFLGFASEANRVLRCDALTPIWLGAVVASSVLLWLLARWSPSARGARLGASVLAGALIAAAFAALVPQCLSRPEGVSDEVARIWLNNVREAKPIYEHPLRVSLPIFVLPLIGLVGALLATWRARRTPALAGWAAVALFTAFACAMLTWQVRAGPAAQLLAGPGAVALAWTVLPWCFSHRSPVVRIAGTAAAFLAVSGMFVGFITRFLPLAQPSERERTVSRAGRLCMTLPALAQLNRVAPATLFTHVDLGPRLIVASHHRGITGPYHRNGDAILDVHRAFMGTDANFLATARAHGADYLLTCPNMAETTNYRARSPRGFYHRLVFDPLPAWLVPVPLPPGSPLRLWRIDWAQAPSAATMPSTTN